MRKSKISSSHHGSTSSLAIFTESPITTSSRAPLFEDASDAAIPGNVHLLSDAALQRMVDGNGPLNLLRQMAKDLAERDSQLTELRKRFEDREKKLKNMLYDCGVSRSEVERRLAQGLQRKPSADSVSSARARSTFSGIETIDTELKTAMDETTFDGSCGRDSSPQGTPRPVAQPQRSMQADSSRTNATPGSPLLGSIASQGSTTDNRPRTGSSFTKWSAGLFGWDSSRKHQSKHSRSAIVKQKALVGDHKSISSLEAQELSKSPTSPDYLGDNDRHRNIGYPDAQVTVRPPTGHGPRTDLWPPDGAPPHFLAIQSAHAILKTSSNNSKGVAHLVKNSASSTISKKAVDLVSQCNTETSGSANPHASSSETSSLVDGRDVSNVHARLQPVSSAKPQDPWIKPLLRDSAQALLPIAGSTRTAAKEASTMEMATIIPDIEQPPTMLPAWQASSNHVETSILTDRYGFKLFDTNSSTRRPKNSLVNKFDDQIPSSKTAPLNDASTTDEGNHDRVHAKDTIRIDHSLPDGSNIAQSAPNINANSIALQGSVMSPQPLSPETSLNKSDAVFSNENGSARLHMLTQLDLHGADKVKQELWDNFLRKTRDDRRKPAKGQDDLIDHIDDEMIGIATMGTGKMAKERRRELVSLVLAGIPIAYRPKVWGEMTGAYRMKEPGYYEELLNHGKDTDPVCVEQIELDLKRTMPSNVFFAGTGLGVPKLRRVLLAYSRHNHEVGYCQGMNVIAATLLLTHPTEEDAFFVLACIVEKILPARYFTPDLLMSRADQIVLKRLVKSLLPKIDSKLAMLGIDLEAITFGWFLSVFTDCLPAEFLFRTWDIFFIEGHIYLFCTALAILRLHEKLILDCHSSGEVYTLLRELGRTRETSVDEFVRLMEHVRMTIKSKGLDVSKMHATAVEEMET